MEACLAVVIVVVDDDGVTMRRIVFLLAAFVVLVAVLLLSSAAFFFAFFAFLVDAELDASFSHIVSSISLSSGDGFIDSLTHRLGAIVIP